MFNNRTMFLFSEPFDMISWLMILLISIHGAAMAIFLFEWLIPYGYDMKMMPPRGELSQYFYFYRNFYLSQIKF